MITDAQQAEILLRGAMLVAGTLLLMGLLFMRSRTTTKKRAAVEERPAEGMSKGREYQPATSETTCHTPSPAGQICAGLGGLGMVSVGVFGAALTTAGISTLVTILMVIGFFIWMSL